MIFGILRAIDGCMLLALQNTSALDYTLFNFRMVFGTKCFLLSKLVVLLKGTSATLHWWFFHTTNSSSTKPSRKLSKTPILSLLNNGKFLIWSKFTLLNANFSFCGSVKVDWYGICRNKRPGRSILRSKKEISKTHRSPSVSCTPPFEKSPIKSHRFCVLPPLKNHPSKPIGFVYSPLWKITHQKPSVLCTPPFEKSPIQKPSVLCTPPFENHPSKSIGFVYSPLWKITIFGGRLFGGGRLFRQIRYIFWTSSIRLLRPGS